MMRVGLVNTKSCNIHAVLMDQQEMYLMLAD